MLWARTNDAALLRQAHGEPLFVDGADASEPWCEDWVRSCLMHTFKTTGDPEVFAMLCDLNRADFLQAIQGRLRAHPCIDANDVLQEAFLNIYRYRSRFQTDRASAFRPVLRLRPP